jgi:putative transcriptional regulator
MSSDEKSTEFGSALIESLQEVTAWKRGEIALLVRNVPAMSAERVKAIRKAVSTSPRDFAKRFGIPARTIEGWEQGRRHPDPAASTLLRVIEKNPKAVEEALAE